MCECFLFSVLPMIARGYRRYSVIIIQNSLHVVKGMKIMRKLISSEKIHFCN